MARPSEALCAPSLMPRQSKSSILEHTNSNVSKVWPSTPSSLILSARATWSRVHGRLKEHSDSTTASTSHKNGSSCRTPSIGLHGSAGIAAELGCAESTTSGGRAPAEGECLCVQGGAKSYFDAGVLNKAGMVGRESWKSRLGRDGKRPNRIEEDSASPSDFGLEQRVGRDCVARTVKNVVAAPCWIVTRVPYYGATPDPRFTAGGRLIVSPA